MDPGERPRGWLACSGGVLVWESAVEEGLLSVVDELSSESMCDLRSASGDDIVCACKLLSEPLPGRMNEDSLLRAA